MAKPLKDSKVEFTEDHINYIFNYLNEMYSDRLTNLEKLVTSNSESLQSLKKDIDQLNSSLNSMLLLNNYKLNGNNSLSTNFSDFFHNFIQFSNNQPVKIPSKSVENNYKSPKNLKPAIKPIKTQPKTLLSTLPHTYYSFCNYN